MINIRTQALERVLEIMGVDSLFRPTLDLCIGGKFGHMIWRGVWQPSQATLVEHFSSLQSQERQKDLTKEIRGITSILVQASLSMYSAASGKSPFLPVRKASVRKRKRKEAEEAIFRMDGNKRILMDWLKIKQPASRREIRSQSLKKRKPYAESHRTYKILNYFKPDPG